MARGRRYGKYTTDAGDNYAMLVEEDRYADADFGWTSGAGLPGLPRRLKPRKVFGLSGTTGYRGSAVVPVLTSDVWTGAATTFVAETDDRGTDTYTITSRRGEFNPIAV